MLKKLLIASLMWVCLGQFAVTPVVADVVDSGSIVVTGTVPPLPSSIVTAIDSNSSSPIAQQKEITYKVTYSSNNTATVPLSFQAAWTKGTVDGATEPNVDVVEYVVGSATAGYGGATPIVDIQNKTITWSISSLPSGTQGQTVEFKLKTTSAYSGSKRVAFPVKVAVLSPVGVSDKQVKLEYQYVASNDTTSSSSTPTPTPTSTPTTATSSAVTSSTVAPLFEGVKLRTIGAVSARIGYSLNRPSNLVVRYGTSPTSLTASQVVQGSSPSLTQDIVITSLQPDTKYFFQLSSVAEPAQRSDVFAFQTATNTGAADATSPLSITISEKRSLLYSGAVASNPNDAGASVVVTQNTVLDLSVQVDSKAEVEQVEVLVRSPGVLGMSTDVPTDLDDLQSTSTRMTELADGVYVGKVRTPVSEGEYQVVSRVEDIYGNIVEKEIGRLQVVAPLTITDQANNQPVEHAEVTIEVFDEGTKLYGLLSNVSTSVANPALSDAKGVVNVHLFAGRYRITVKQFGYETQVIEFEVGASGVTHYPQVRLVRSRLGILGSLNYTGGVAMLGLQHVTSFVHEVSTSVRMVTFFLYLSVALFVVGSVVSILLFKNERLNPEYWLLRPYTHRYQHLLAWISYFCLQFVRFCGEFFVLLCLLFGLLFFWNFGFTKGAPILLVTSLVMALWSFDLIFLKTHRPDCPVPPLPKPRTWRSRSSSQS